MSKRLKNLTGATLFSGIGAPETAMPHWDWPWHAEIEKFPSSVLAQRHPDSANLGDVTANDFTERAAEIARPDVLVFGSPCQSYSIAGKRLGMDDPRGNLALIALGIVDRIKPRWFVFENVPGLFSSFSGSEHAESTLRDRAERGGGQVGEAVDAEENRDLATFFSRISELGYSGAWASLDAQWFGVAQRRERLFFVGHSGDWRGPAAVLFEPVGLHGHHPPDREAGKNVAPTIASRPTGGGGLGTDFDCDGGLIAPSLNAGMARRRGGGAHGDPMIAMCLNAGGMGRQDAETETLIASHDVAQPLLAKANSSHRADAESYVAHALRADGFDASEDGTGRGTPIIPIDMRQASRGDKFTNNRAPGSSGGAPGIGIGEAGDPSPTIASSHVPAIAFSCKDHGADAMDDCAPTLRAGTHDKSHANAGVPPAVTVALRGREGGGAAEMGGEQATALRASQGGGDKPHVLTSAVRRLTPRECERLQGFPDDYTAVRYRGKPAADGPRYKALGNSMAVPVMRWILSRIEAMEVSHVG